MTVSKKAKPDRSKQRLRTRKDLLRAASRILKEGRKPTLEEVAAEALVSRATVYRYFRNIEALLVEAPLDFEVPNPERIFATVKSSDPEERVDKAEAALHKMVYEHEAQLRILLMNSLTQQMETQSEGDVPVRQNRRTPLIEAALAPARDRFNSVSYRKLCAALALIFGPESMLVFRDVLPLSAKTAREVKSWMVRILVRAALAEST